MKKLLFYAIVALGMLACTEKEQNVPDLKSTDGALSGKFSVSRSTKVQFSKGNLQYNVGTQAWRFAENQYNIIGESDQSESEWIDIFGWGTGNKPTLSSTNYNAYSIFNEWGANAISNGGNKANLWRTLTGDEWDYLFNSRTNAAKLFGIGSVNGINGTILLPDDWSGDLFNDTENGLAKKEDYYRNESGTNFTFHTYTAEQWAEMEKNGAVFLPAIETIGSYWSATSLYGGSLAYNLYFSSYVLSPKNYTDRYNSLSVRLVH